MAPGGPPMSEVDWAKLIKSWFPGAGQPKAERADLAGDRAAPRLHQAAVGDDHGHHDPPAAASERKLKASLTSLRRWFHQNLPDQAARSKVTVLREEVEPGSEAQIDYGFLGQWINPRTGKRHRIWAFVMA